MKQQKGDPAPAPNPFKYPQILVFSAVVTGILLDPYVYSVFALSKVF